METRDYKALAIIFIFVVLYAATYEHGYYEGYGARYDYDEFRNLVVAKRIAETGIPLLLSCEFIIHPPLFFFLGSVLGAANVYLAGSLVTLASAFAVLWLTYILAKRVLCDSSALVAVVIVATSTLFWFYSNRFLHTQFFTALTLLSIWLLLEQRTKALGAVLGLMLLTKGTAVVFIGVVGIWYLLNVKKAGTKKTLLSLITVGVIVLAVYFPYILYMSSNNLPWNPVQIQHITITGDREYIESASPLFYFGNTFSIFSDGLLNGVFLAFFIFGAAALARLQHRDPLLSFLLLLVFVYFVGFGVFVNAKELKYVMSVQIFFAIVSAYGFESLASKRRTWRLVLASLLVFAAYSSLMFALDDGVYYTRSPTFQLAANLDIGSALLSTKWPQVYVLTDHDTDFLYNSSLKDFRRMLTFQSEYMLVTTKYPYFNDPAIFTPLMHDNVTGFNFTLYYINLSAIERGFGFPKSEVITVTYDGKPVPSTWFFFPYNNNMYQMKMNKSGQNKIYFDDGYRTYIQIRSLFYMPVYQNLYFANDEIYCCDEHFYLCKECNLTFELAPNPMSLEHTFLCERY